MTASEELQRRIEKSLAENSFSQPELLIRRAHRIAREGLNGSAAAAGNLLKEAGSDIGVSELNDIIDRKPWLLETIITDAGKKKNTNSGRH
ncbi:hypothetical protein FHS76_002514 [Ochrobactrum daejeonense]|uniref:Uncharacterized protein n=1 Tax=Brucella daejeonensis TaxID=659015 RepID=A0A7W9EN19_9HYPH|nr:hypothetical protein [Brucella daejeonensis]MBB5702630.1 hypothetical protein [Brucella daejeonensis]NKB79141.1 hypothetical protein [Brucella daejeonensis]